MLALRPAFEGSERNSLIRKVTTESPPTLRKIDPRVPRNLETIINKAIEREPERRYQTAGELAEDLRLFLDDKPIRARPVHLTERVWRWSRRNPALAGMAGAILLLLATAAVGSGCRGVLVQKPGSERGDRPQQAECTPDAEQQRREADKARQQADAEQERRPGGGQQRTPPPRPTLSRRSASSAVPRRASSRPAPPSTTRSPASAKTTCSTCPDSARSASN